jgi:hypothetical protein
MSSSFYTVQSESLLDEEREVSVEESVLEPTPIPHGRLHEFNARGRTLKSTMHPLLLQGQAWISENRPNIRSQTSLIVFVA